MGGWWRREARYPKEIFTLYTKFCDDPLIFTIPFVPFPLLPLRIKYNPRFGLNSWTRERGCYKTLRATHNERAAGRLENARVGVMFRVTLANVSSRHSSRWLRGRARLMTLCVPKFSQQTGRRAALRSIHWLPHSTESPQLIGTLVARGGGLRVGHVSSLAQASRRAALAALAAMAAMAAAPLPSRVVPTIT